jgi:ABC-type transport system involved in multi-copper enzyme maturation permease subunit
MQDNFVNDTAGSTSTVSAASPRWLRLTRSGDTITGSESTDGTSWTDVGTVRLAGLPDTVLAGLFVTSPDHEVTTQSFGELDTIGGPTVATATFDHVELTGQGTTGSWNSLEVSGGGGGLPPGIDPIVEANGAFTVSGAGNIAPIVAGPGSDTVEQALIGAFAALIVVIVLGTMFITSEYRRGLIRTTLVASPHRGRVLAAKAIVLGTVTFVVGLAASIAAFALVSKIRSDRGIGVYPASSLTEVRIVVGTAALLAVAAVLAMAIGAVFRRGAGAVTAAVVMVVLPYILAVASVLPVGPARWLLRLTPAAAFAIQQSTTEYFQVTSTYTPSTGYFPLAPWAGFGVLCAWTAAALGVAVVLLRRRDA